MLPVHYKPIVWIKSLGEVTVSDSSKKWYYSNDCKEYILKLLSSTIRILVHLQQLALDSFDGNSLYSWLLDCYIESLVIKLVGTILFKTEVYKWLLSFSISISLID